MFCMIKHSMLRVLKYFVITGVKAIFLFFNLFIFIKPLWVPECLSKSRRALGMTRITPLTSEAIRKSLRSQRLDFLPAILEAWRGFEKKSFLAALLQWTLEFKGDGFARSPLLLVKEKHYLLLKIGGTTVMEEEICGSRAWSSPADHLIYPR